MRYISYLLSLYVVILSTVPCCPEKDCCEDETDTCQKPGEQKKDCNTTCSPFYSCCSCNGSIISNAICCIFDTTGTAEEKKIVPESEFTDFFIFSFWQPPKIA